MKASEISVPRRVYHWVNLICMIALGVSGAYIHRPFTPGLMGTMRYWHFVFMYIFGINLILRVYYALRDNGDWRKYLKPNIERETLGLTFRHYVLYKHLPDGEEYRILQNVSYLALVILFFIQIITGVLLYDSEGRFTEQMISFLGGINVIRQVHLFLLWIFIAFTIVHIYMAFTEDFPKVKLIFFGVADEK